MSEKKIQLATGDYIELEDGRVRGPIGYACTENGTARYSLHSCMDDDLKLGWWVFGVYADRASNLDYDRPRDVKRVLTLDEVKAAVGSVHITIPPRGKMLPIEDPDAERLEPVLMNKSQRETVFQLIAERQAASEAPQVEPTSGEREWRDVKEIYYDWINSPAAAKDSPELGLNKAAFLAGYNTALRNEIGQGIQPSEKAQVGLSDLNVSGVVAPCFPVEMSSQGFMATGIELDRLNPVIRRFGEAFAAANDGRLAGVWFKDRGLFQIQIETGSETPAIRHVIEVALPPGFSYPDLVDVVEQKAERVRVAVTAAYRKGFEDAFGATSEGYNAEYPFQRKGIDFKTDEDWQRFYRAFLLDADLTAKPEPKLPPIPTPEDLADAMLKSIGKSLAAMGDNHKGLWTGMAKVAIEQLRGPDLHPWKPQPIYKPGNHPAHIEADMALEAAIEAAI